MDDPRQQHVSALSQAAVAHAQEQFGVHLDSTDGSIALVEGILGDIFARIPHSRLARFFRRKPTFHDLAHVANIYGAYVGEVLRQRCGGEWTETELCGCEHILVLRISADLSVMPTTKTWNRLTMGPSENVVTFFQRTLQRSAALGGKSNQQTASVS